MTIKAATFPLKRTTLIANIYSIQIAFDRHTHAHNKIKQNMNLIWFGVVNAFGCVSIRTRNGLSCHWHDAAVWKETQNGKTNWPFGRLSVRCFPFVWLMRKQSVKSDATNGLMRWENRLWSDGTKSKSVTDAKPLSSSWLNYSFILPQFRYRSGRWTAAAAHSFFLPAKLFSLHWLPERKIFSCCNPSSGTGRRMEIEFAREWISTGVFFFRFVLCCAMRLFYVGWPLAILSLPLSTISLCLW